MVIGVWSVVSLVGDESPPEQAVTIAIDAIDAIDARARSRRRAARVIVFGRIAEWSAVPAGFVGARTGLQRVRGAAPYALEFWSVCGSGARRISR